MNNFVNNFDFGSANTSSIDRDTDRGNHISCRVSNSIITYLESIGFDVDSILKGLPCSKEYLKNPFNWIPYSVEKELNERVTRAVGDEQLMYKVGLATPKLASVSGIEQMVRVIGNPKQVYQSVPRFVSYFTSLAKLEVNIIDDCKAVITMSIPAGYPVSKNQCYYAQRLLAAIPTIWDLPPAEVHEQQCVCEELSAEQSGVMKRSAEKCIYEVTWQSLPTKRTSFFSKLLMRGRDRSASVKAIEENYRLLDERNEQLSLRNNQLAKVRELALHVDTSHTVNEVLETVVEAAREIPGVRFVLVLTIDDEKQEVNTTYYSKIRSESVTKALKSIGFDLETQLGKNPTDRKLTFKVADLKIAQDFLSNPHTVVENELWKILDGVWPKLLCDSIQKVLGVKQFVLIPMMIMDKSWGSMFFILDDSVPVDFLEMVGVHCATGMQNVSTLEALHGSEERFRNLVENLPLGISITSPDGQTLMVNKTFLNMHGYDSEEDMNQTPVAMHYYDPKDRELWLAMIKEKGRVEGFEVRLKRKDGSIFWASSTSIPLTAASGEQRLIEVTQDITQHKQAEEKERKLQIELNMTGRLATVGEMAAGIAHEINNPLTGVVGYSSLLLEKDVPEDIRKQLNVIHDGARRIAGITNRMLSLSRQSKPSRTNVNINEIIKSTLAIRSYAMKSDSISVTTELDPNLPLTYADAGLLQQVFLNIILNAEIEMKSAHGKGNLTVNTDRIDGTIRISFKDDGPGIAQENLDKIFDPFFTTRDPNKGTGLGLSIGYNIVTQHNGKIYAESILGKGATFFIELPIVAVEEQLKPDEPAAVMPPVASKARIVVVDDDLSVQQFIATVLTRKGHAVDIVDNGNDAIKRLTNQAYDVILMDIKLPGVSGIEIYRELQKSSPSLVRKVIFITGDVFNKTTVDFINSTRTPYISKPFDAERLENEISRTISQQAEDFEAWQAGGI